eukprot:GHVP01003832.1.p1 GENE.GHVP01003832.1~~GHVP01003832.1.p1  ORF type:complete len:109 (-),score=13.34 GHVP01003832.1:541-867(-)
MPEEVPIITLISSDNISYSVKREHVMHSKFLASLIESSNSFGIRSMFNEANTNTIRLTNVCSDYMPIILSYMEYKTKWENSDEEIVPEFEFPDHMAVDILMISDFLML